MAGPTTTVLKEVLFAVVAFAPYWLLGVPPAVLIGGGSSRFLRFAGLLGCGIAGLLAEYGFIFRMSHAVNFSAALILCGIWSYFLLRRMKRLEITEVLGEAFLFSLVGVWVGMISPFAVVGVWGGDWYTTYCSGAALSTDSFPAFLLARPPLFGGGATLVWFAIEGLPGFQVYCGIASAALLSALAFVLRRFLSGRALMLALLGFAATAFFLHNTANAWPKHLAAGLILASVVLARMWSESQALSLYLGVCLTFCLSVATHQSSVFYLPVIVCCLLARPIGWRPVAHGTLILGAVALLVIVPFEAWTIRTFGLAAKIASNPSVSDRRTLSFLENSALVSLTSIVAWAPLTEAWAWLVKPDRFDSATVTKAALGVCAAWVTSLAGAFLGLVLPFWRLRKVNPALSSAFRSPRWMIGSILFVWVANAALNPYWSPYGCLQTGLQGFAVLAFWWMAENKFLEFSKMTIWRCLLLEACPWLLLNVAVTLGLSLSFTFQQSFDDSDYQLMKATHLEAMGLRWFPVGHILITATLFGCAYRFLSRSIDIAHPVAAIARNSASPKKRRKRSNR